MSNDDKARPVEGIVGLENSAVRRAEYWKAEKLAADAEICALLKLASDAYNAWDADQDARVGKLLRAMVDGEFRRTYRPDLLPPNSVLDSSKNISDSKRLSNTVEED